MLQAQLTRGQAHWDAHHHAGRQLLASCRQLHAAQGQAARRRQLLAAQTAVPAGKVVQAGARSVQYGQSGQAVAQGIDPLRLWLWRRRLLLLPREAAGQLPREAAGQLLLRQQQQQQVVLAIVLKVGLGPRHAQRVGAGSAGGGARAAGWPAALAARAQRGEGVGPEVRGGAALAPTQGGADGRRRQRRQLQGLL
jgi:hypothetical protein